MRYFEISCIKPPKLCVYFNLIVKQSKAAQSCPTLCDHMHWAYQASLPMARVLEWVAFPSPGILPL